MIKGQVSHELEVGAPAAVVWETYGTLQLGKLVVKLLPNIFQDIQAEGDGGVGTVLSLTFAPVGAPAFAVYKEKFTKIDHENRVKETEVVEGGFLDLGFLLYRIRLQVLEKDSDSSIIQSTIEYELAEEAAANVSLVSTDSLVAIAEVIGNHLAEEYKAKLNS
ncbi:Bet v I domain-containing protein [Cinnamomum micranthum f. kanehirae]|uniref:Bet v I domain-containing protein n=1 Tax=Cinnamomum micranthum f. kanehirae TaxID=337451 RepID=A0A443PFZ5_9MAGN|nr:Bet v I domain-containing protein [Cinnamomum micranthum f. kanehirae]